MGRRLEASGASAAASSSLVASLSLKRPRTPRKRPSQTYNEAAALLVSIYPSVFPVRAGSSKAVLLGEATVNLAEYADALKPSAVTLLLKDSPRALLHVTIHDAMELQRLSHVTTSAVPFPILRRFHNARGAQLQQRSEHATSNKLVPTDATTSAAIACSRCSVDLRTDEGVLHSGSKDLQFTQTCASWFLQRASEDMN